MDMAGAGDVLGRLVTGKRRPITYYLDPSAYNELSHQPGRPDLVDKMRRSRLRGHVVTYAGRYILRREAADPGFGPHAAVAAAPQPHDQDDHA